MPETDDLSNLLPEEAGEFTLQRAAQSGLNIGTDTYVIARYTGPDGGENDIIVAQFDGATAAESGVTSIREMSTQPVTGSFTDEAIAVVVDAQSESTARSLLQATDINCADQLSFSSGGSDATSTAEQFDVGTPIWGHRSASAAGTGAVDAQGITTGDPSSYSIGLPANSDIEYYPFYDPVFTENALIYRGSIREKETGDSVRELPATETATPAISSGQLYMIAGAEVIAADIESGDELWRTTTGKNGIGIVASNGRVFIAQGDGVTALSASDGSREWNISTGALNDQGRGIFAVADGRLYASTPRQRGTTVHDVSDGTQLWSVDGRGVSQLGPQGTLYFNEGGAVDSGTVTRFDSEGSQMWETRPSGSTSPVAAEDDRVYLSDNDSPTVTTISHEDGSEQWTADLPQGIADLAVGSDRVYALGSGRDDTTRLFALNKQSGEQENIYALDSDASTPRGAGGVTVGGGVVSVMRSNINNNRMQVLTDN